MNASPWVLGYSLFTCAALGCSAQGTPHGADPDAPERGPIGKADLVGSCQTEAQDWCGGPSAGECWCDEECEGYGDCCSDYHSVCGDSGSDGDSSGGSGPVEPIVDGLDVNGDGYADLAVGAPSAAGIESGGFVSGNEPREVGKLFVYLGGPDGLDPTPYDELQPPGEGGNYFANILRSYTRSDGSGRHGIVSSSTRLWRDGGLSRRLWPYERAPVYGYHVAALGDIDGDGVEEVATGGPGRIHIYSTAGGSTLIYGEPFEPANPNPDWGLFVWGVGDVNGDGFDDALMSAGRTLPVELLLHLGSEQGLNPEASASMYSSLSEGVAHADLDGDGRQDVLVGSYHENEFAGQVNLYSGTPTGLSDEPTTVIDPPDSVESLFGASVAVVGDVNGDGAADVAIRSQGAVHVYYADGTGIPTEASVTLLNPGDGRRDGFGQSVSGGDYNGDGFSDLAVGAPGAPANYNYDGPGRVYIFEGSASGVATSPSLAIDSPEDSYSTNGSSYWPRFGKSLR